jgi:hypothetical protein
MLNDTPRLNLMIDKLYDAVSRGYIDNDWEESFILDMHDKKVAGSPYSLKQAAKIEELFERY